MAIKVAHGLVRPGIVGLLELSPEHSFIEMPAPEVFAGKYLQENQLRRDWQGIAPIYK